MATKTKRRPAAGKTPPTNNEGGTTGTTANKNKPTKGKGGKKS